MVSAQMSPASDSENNARKRVCKACDRCRLKKSKCDGSSPCSRCRSDNAICVFGERKKSHDKVYPKGYVEMLEQQQLQLVNGLQELYERLVNNQGWKGAPLENSNSGHPLTHDILDRLGALKLDNNISYEVFEDNVNAMRKRFVADGALPIQRPSSTDSEYNQSQTSFAEPTSPKLLFNEPPPTFNQFPPTPPSQSPQVQSATSIKMETSMDSDVLQFQQNSWIQTPLIYDEPMDFLPFNAASAYENMRSLQQGSNPCLPMSHWIEDDLGAFEMNTSIA